MKLVPDSSNNVCIEDCNITVGYDAIALKSGWDEYGISYNRPTTNIHIKTVNLQAESGAALAFGSEMSGGISDVLAESLHLSKSSSGIELRTTKGRGGYIRDILISNTTMESVRVALNATGQCGSHPDEKFDPTALPVLDLITIKNVVGSNVTLAGNFTGILESPFTSICLSNISLSINNESSSYWVCSNIFGFSKSVSPEPCRDLESTNTSSACFSLLDSSDRFSVL